MPGKKKYVSISLRLAQCTLQRGDAQQMFMACLNIKHHFIPSSKGVEPAGEFKYIGEKILVHMQMHSRNAPWSQTHGIILPARRTDTQRGAVTCPKSHSKLAAERGLNLGSLLLGALSRDVPSFVAVSLAAPGAAKGAQPGSAACLSGACWERPEPRMVSWLCLSRDKVWEAVPTVASALEAGGSHPMLGQPLSRSGARGQLRRPGHLISRSVKQG